MSDGRETPRARTSGLVVKTLAEEVLVYDLTRHRAHSLNRAAAAVWRRLDGRTSIGDLAQHLRQDLGGPADESAVWLALKELDRAHLLETPLRVPAAQGLSRRQWLRRVGVAAGASAVLVPTVSTIVAPHAYAQASPSGCFSRNPGCEMGVCPGGSGNCACAALVGPGIGRACVEPFCTDVTCTSNGDCPFGQVCSPTAGACCENPGSACVPLCGAPVPVTPMTSQSQPHPSGWR
jgi:hypothetical protein